jgi:hypothetical protein
MHVILTSLEATKENKVTGSLSYQPLLWGQSGGEISGYTFMVMRLIHRAKLQGKDLRMVEDAIDQETAAVGLLKPSGTYEAKDQYLTGLSHIVDPTITKILDAIEKAYTPNDQT